ncbi:hypothetical protein V6N12_027389 [Hibiscus sabdariffa]|uniref:Uncharacterized protein n=1 Tax=Hibiscus sabdariffa TaxID=183260 RepID=A0ABR2DUM7_9ROSI
MTDLGIYQLCHREDEDMLRAIPGYPRVTWIVPSGVVECPVRFTAFRWLIWNMQTSIITYGLQLAAEFVEGMKRGATHRNTSSVASPT